MERYNLILLSGAVAFAGAVLAARGEALGLVLLAFAGAMFYVATSPGRES